MIQTGIFSLITGFTDVAALIATRVYPMTLPEAPTLPALSYQIVGGTSSPTFETSGMQKLRVQFDAWGADPDSAANVRATLIKALNGFQGQLTDGTFLQNADLQQQIDFFADDPRQYRCMVEFYFYFDFSS